VCGLHDVATNYTNLQIGHAYAFFWSMYINKLHGFRKFVMKYAFFPGSCTLLFMYTHQNHPVVNVVSIYNPFLSLLHTSCRSSAGTSNDKVGRLLGVRGNLVAVHLGAGAVGADKVIGVAVAGKLVSQDVELGQLASIVGARKDATSTVGVCAVVVGLVGDKGRVAKDGDGNDYCSRYKQATLCVFCFIMGGAVERKGREGKRAGTYCSCSTWGLEARA
jgi:hypothetical protein